MSEDTTPVGDAAGAAGPVLTALGEAFPDTDFRRFTPPSGPAQDIASVAAADLVGFVAGARDAGYTMFVDLCGVDYLRRDPRYDVVITVLDIETRSRLRIVVGVAASEPSVPSITDVFAGANFYERETYDLFGIDFPGHPDLTRILLPDDWAGHPLRKDYAVGSVPVQFKAPQRAT